MKSLPPALIIEKNKMSTSSAWLVFLDITLTDNTEFRFVSNNEDVTFGGNLYTHFPFEVDTVGQSGRGEIPNVRLKVSNVTRLLQPYLESLEGAIGSTVKVTVVNSKHLDEDYSELEMTFDVISCNSTSKWVTFTLGAPNPLRQRFPLEEFIANHCRFIFKSDECGYSGGETTCNGTMSDCDDRSNLSRFGGFPGMRDGSLRVA